MPDFAPVVAVSPLAKTAMLLAAKALTVVRDTFAQRHMDTAVGAGNHRFRSRCCRFAALRHWPLPTLQHEVQEDAEENQQK
jgi:hypothetical protein